MRFKSLVPMLQTREIDETRTWYETVLGAHVVHGNAMIAFLTYDDEHHRIAILNAPGAADRPRDRSGHRPGPGRQAGARAEAGPR